MCPLSNEKASKARKDVQSVYEGIFVLRYYGLVSVLSLFLFLLLFLSMVLCPFILTVATAFHSASVCLHSWRFNISAVWKLCGCKFYAKFITFMFVGGLFISFSVSLLLKSCVNICA